MGTVSEYKKIIRIIDRTFAHHERRLVELREETVRYLREELIEAHIDTHSTPGPTLGGSSEPV